MGNKRFRILLDLSLITEGFSGVPQVTRLLYRMLSQTPEVDLTGLVYCPRGSTAAHRFTRSSLPADRLANQAQFLQALASRTPPLSAVRGLRWLQHLIRLYGFSLEPSVRCQEMDSAAFWDVLWRNFMHQSLQPEDVNLVRAGKFLLSTYSNRAMNVRLLGKLPAQGLDTHGYDFVIFQDARVARVSRQTRKIVCYHDLIPILRPDCLANRHSIKLHHRSVRAASRDSYFVCNTEHTRGDLTGAYPVTRDHSCVIPYPLSSSYYPQRNVRKLESILTTRQSSVIAEHPPKVLGKPVAPYVLAVSTLEPRKNYASIIRAFHALNALHENVLHLVIVGAPGWNWAPIESLMKPLIKQGQLIHLMHVSPEEMRILYSHARVLVFASYYEGFGLSPVEAMQCHVPVVLSDTPPHREVAGDAALYCDPYDTNSIRKALWRLLFSSKSKRLRKTLIWRGRKQLRRYDEDRLRGQWLELFARLRPDAQDAARPQCPSDSLMQSNCA
ncbi:MAG: glycosyltransferase family 4 protein [Gemmataceae bacterium]